MKKGDSLAKRAMADPQLTLLPVLRSRRKSEHITGLLCEAQDSGGFHILEHRFAGIPNTSPVMHFISLNSDCLDIVAPCNPESRAHSHCQKMGEVNF